MTQGIESDTPHRILSATPAELTGLIRHIRAAWAPERA